MNTQALHSLNMAFNSGACTAAGAAATLTVVTAVDATVKGVWATQVSAAAKTLAAVTTEGVSSADATGYAATTFNALYGGASTNAAAPANNDGQACILVHCTNASGEVKSIQGASVQLDESGNLMKAAEFPVIPDTLTPFCYQLLKAGLTAGDITPGTSNWSATGHTNTVVNVAVLPNRPVTA
jgi:hypothetical protein